MPANQIQRKHLQERINKAVYRKQSTIREESSELRKHPPAAVARAQAQRDQADKIIRAHHHKLDVAREKALKRVEAEADKARERVLFGEPEEALAMVKQFEP